MLKIFKFNLAQKAQLNKEKDEKKAEKTAEKARHNPRAGRDSDTEKDAIHMNLK